MRQDEQSTQAHSDQHNVGSSPFLQGPPQPTSFTIPSIQSPTLAGPPPSQQSYQQPLPPQQQQQQQQQQHYQQAPYPSSPGSTRFPSQPASAGFATSPSSLQSPQLPSLPPPVRPVFGVDLEELFQRDGTAVPMVVYQCMQAVDLFGLDVEGIYRLSGTATHVQQLKAVFDNDAASVDFRNPASFHHDVNSVAGLLKLFFRDLPDPLLTRERYSEVIAAARIDDDTVRRDTLHAIINALPDANYATLRALVLVCPPT